MILDEARIHRYTHINYKLSAMNIKYYNFDSSFDRTEFCGENIYRCKSDTLDDTMGNTLP
jgi:hypothetical protein